MSGFSENYSALILEHIAGKKALPMPTCWMALTTVVPTASSTGSTIVEANYTGYLRREVPGSLFLAAVEGLPSEIKNKESFTFAACTGSSSKVIGWALCDAHEKGRVIMWGTATETTISVTNTPPTVPSEVLVMELQ